MTSLTSLHFDTKVLTKSEPAFFFLHKNTPLDKFSIVLFSVTFTCHSYPKFQVAFGRITIDGFVDGVGLLDRREGHQCRSLS